MAFTLFRFKEWQKKYKELQENVVYTQQIAQIGTWTRDYETKSLFITDELCRILGCNPFEFKGDSEIFMKHVHEGDRQWVQEYMSKVQQGSDYDIEYRIVTESGEHKIVRERTKTIYDQEKPIRTFGVMQDITEKKRMENDLRELGDVYIRAQKVSGVGSFKYDAQNNLSVWSDEVCRI
ncbi:MAG TPA: hypothetical protein DHN33_00095, partial [Eubacteriaceae bacterium]|nr:hypothetical protein [Eubacteriaceae bacterium]